MRFAGIDIASETHVPAIVAADGAVALKATSFTEDDLGYQKALTLLGPPGEVPIAMEATGHCWKNLFAVLAAAGHSVALLNPLRTHRFAGVDLERTKTDAIDALGIARFAVQKHPTPTPVPDALTEELREHEVGRLLAICSVAKHRQPFVPHVAFARAAQ
jgi:transposase